MKAKPKLLSALLSLSLLLTLPVPVRASGLPAPEASAPEAPVPEASGAEASVPDVLGTEAPAPDPSGTEASAAQAQTIVSFTGLEDAVSQLTYDRKPSLGELTDIFPKTLQAQVTAPSADGNAGEAQTVDIPVTWTCTEDYEATQSESYRFTPQWDLSAYSTAEGAEPGIPSIRVTLSVKRASTYITDMSNAKAELQSLLSGNPVMALVYLCDGYTVRSAPGSDSSSVGTAYSGQSVQITDVSEDAGRNIWYKVVYSRNGGSVEGYVERGNLAYSDEELLAWEKKYIVTMQFRSAGGGEDRTAAEIDQFPESYREPLRALKAAHPNWAFVKMNTNLNWNVVLDNEMDTSGGGKSLIHSGSPDAWKNGDTSQKGWSYASRGILAHYMDPRNFLTEQQVFQFELLTYNSSYHTQDAVQNILNGSFMAGMLPDEGRSYAEVFYSAGSSLNVSPFHLASRVRQEQGTGGTSPLISGNYDGAGGIYKGYYNYYNIGATGKTTQEVIENGLKKAMDSGWAKRSTSLEGGAAIITENYIRKGQDTLYLQKFNVDGTYHGLYGHQYMQNIKAPASEAPGVYKGYGGADSLNNPFVFKIPVFNEMPSSACPQPTEGDTPDKLTLTPAVLSLPVGQTAALTPLINGGQTNSDSVIFASSDTTIATVDAGGVVTGVSAGVAEISCTKEGAEKAVCNVTVIASAPSFTVPDIPESDYDPGRTLAGVALPSGWKWVNPSIVPTVGNTGYSAVYTPQGSGTNEPVTVTVPVRIRRAIPAYHAPSNLEGAYGSRLSSVTLPSGFQWETSETTVMNNLGTNTYYAAYNPDSNNYSTVSNIPLSVRVVCASHKYWDWIVTAAATCTLQGTETRTCSVCGYQESRNTPSLGHNYSSRVTREPTEKEEGIRTYTCSRCGDTYTQSIDKLPSSHKHSYTSQVTTEPTCTANGLRTFRCGCGDTYTETISAYGHNMVDGKCTRCGYTEPKEPPVTVPAPPDNNTGNGNNGNGSPSGTSGSGGSSTGATAGQPGAGAAGQQPGTGVTGTAGGASGGNGQGEAGVTQSGLPAQAAAGGNTQSGNSGNSSGRNFSGTGAKDGSGSGKASGENPIITMELTDSTTLSEGALKLIQEKGADVELAMGSGARWNIYGGNVDPEDVADIDMGVTIETENLPAWVTAAAGDQPVRLLSLAHEGDYGFTPVLTMEIGAEHAGRIANLFYIGGGEMEFVDAQTIDEQGNVSFTFTHASDYAVIIGDGSLEGVTLPGKDDAGDDGNPGDPADGGKEAAAAREMEEMMNSSVGGLSTQTVLIIVVILLALIASGIGIALAVRERKRADEDGYPDEVDAPDEGTAPDEREEVQKEDQEPDEGWLDEP